MGARLNYFGTTVAMSFMKHIVSAGKAVPTRPCRPRRRSW